LQAAVLREHFDYSWATPTGRKALYQGLSRPALRRRGANSIRRHCIKDGVFIDPTCGSGAFLFAALNILEPLYAVCLRRMQDYLDHDYKGMLNRSTRRYFDEQLELVESDIHPNVPYFIYKSIILNNLYGVDIMREAVETAKLRLFLKLVSTAEPNYRAENIGIEPLPDIDFNIKAGNTLIGYANETDVDNMQLTGGLVITSEALADVKDKMYQLAKATTRYKELQLGAGDYCSEDFKAAKADLTNRQAALKSLLDAELRKVYSGVSDSDWQNNYAPFHWVSEFYKIIVEDGGFDVVIGNPPYVEYSKVRKSYALKDYKTISCGNLYAFVIERVQALVGGSGASGMIVPISLVSTPRMREVRVLLSDYAGRIYLTNFCDRPASLFTGVHQKVTIVLTMPTTSEKLLFTTNYYHWYSQSSRNEREFLFDTVRYVENESLTRNWSKIGSCIELSIYDKVTHSLGTLGEGSQFAWLNMRMQFWGKCFVNEKTSNEYRRFGFITDNQRNNFVSFFNSSLFFWFWEAVSDCWHITKQELNGISIPLLTDGVELSNLAILLENDLEAKKGYVGTVQTDYEYYHKLSKPIIDRIDTILAKHYGFTEEELDYIINYDIKYRMGLGGDAEGGDED